MTQRLTARSRPPGISDRERVLCLPDGAPITRDRVIKAIRGAQRWRVSEAGCSRVAAYLLFASGDEGRASSRDPGTGRTRGSVDDAALHAPESGGDGRRDSVAGWRDVGPTAAKTVADIVETGSSEVGK